MIFERVRAWFARLRGRADPGLVDMTKLVPVSVGVFGILVFFGLILILADLVNPIHLTLGWPAGCLPREQRGKAP